MVFTSESQYVSQAKYLPKINLSASSFATGPVVLSTRGVYTLTEDVVIDWNGVVPPSSQVNQLGFFAAIIVTGSNVVIDGAGHTIEMSPLYWRRQRFFSLIQLNSSPFARNEGPMDFGKGLPAATNVMVKNLKLGLSAHHGILGNDAQGVYLTGLDIFSFEVGGISLNGCSEVIIDHVDVHDNVAAVPFNAHLSQAINLVDLGTKAGVDVSALGALVTQQLAMGVDTTLQLFANANLENLSDGGTYYGINLHGSRLAVNAFDNGGVATLNGAKIQYVKIYNLVAAPINWVGVIAPGDKKPMLDSQGTVFPYDIEAILSDPTHPQYVLWDAAYRVSSAAIPNGRANLYSRPVTGTAYLYADTMNHLCKGLNGLVIGKYIGVRTRDVQIYNLLNKSPGLQTQTAATAKHPANHKNIFMGTAANAVVVNSPKLTYFDIKNIVSHNGTASNIVVVGESVTYL